MSLGEAFVQRLYARQKELYSEYPKTKAISDRLTFESRM
jgi:hypothetical protein